MIHRDLKPSNVVVGKYGETLVVDWGLAKFVGRDEEHDARDEETLRPSSHSGSTDTIAGIAVGTPAFMSPEQAEGDLGHVGFASDIYGLGRDPLLPADGAESDHGPGGHDGPPARAVAASSAGRARSTPGSRRRSRRSA